MLGLFITIGAIVGSASVAPLIAVLGKNPKTLREWWTT